MRDMFAVWDSKMSAFLPPFSLPNVGLASRWFHQAVNGGVPDWNKYAEDFTLFRLGTFEDETGRMKSFDAPESICTALSIRE